MNLDVLAVGAHPDDVELTCAGTLLRLVSLGYKTAMVSLTAGELGTRGSRAERRREFEASAAILGVEQARILDLPDGFLEADSGSKRRLLDVIRQMRPRLVLAPYWSDRHPDHARASRLVTEASFLAGLPKIETGQRAFRPHRVLYYPSRQDFPPSFIVDVTPFHERKLQAVACYRSQFDPETAGEPTQISRPQFLEAIVARARLYGSYIGTDYGEAFLVREPLRLDDPVAFFGEEYRNAFL